MAARLRRTMDAPVLRVAVPVVLEVAPTSARLREMGLKAAALSATPSERVHRAQVHLGPTALAQPEPTRERSRPIQGPPVAGVPRVGRRPQCRPAQAARL